MKANSVLLVVTICVLIIFIPKRTSAQQAFTQRYDFGDTKKSFINDENDKLKKRRQAIKDHKFTISTKDQYPKPRYFDQLSTFGIYGIGNLNTPEDFQALNASGKLSGFVRPVIAGRSFLTTYFSYNRNATNSDSLLSSTFLFPDVGTSSFATTVEYAFLLTKPIPSRKDDDRINFHFGAPFLEFATKNIKGQGEKDNLSFSTLNYALGFKYQFNSHKEKDDASFSVAPYLAWINVADQDNEDYWALFNDENKQLRSTVRSWGVKVAFQYNNFQIFADLKSVRKSDVSIREIQGFNSNIGIVFNAEIFER